MLGHRQAGKARAVRVQRGADSTGNWATGHPRHSDKESSCILFVLYKFEPSHEVICWVKENSRQQNSQAGAGLLLSAFCGLGRGNSKGRAEEKPRNPCDVTKKESEGLKGLDKGVWTKKAPVTVGQMTLLRDTQTLYWDCR